MKKFTIISVFLLLACAGIHAQGLTLSLDITAGGLEAAMTSEQKKAVTNLTLTGSLNDSDFYLIRDNMPKLEELNLKEADVKVIPKKGLAYPSKLLFITLPRSLEVIEDSAFNYNLGEITFTGPFPKIGKDISEEDPYLNYYVSDDNAYCKEIDGSIYSADNKILFLFKRGVYYSYMEEGVERISSHAFSGCVFYPPSHHEYPQICFPSSLKHIEANAFYDIKPTVLSRFIYNEWLLDFVCHAPVPPTLGDSVFCKKYIRYSTLYVPETSIELYKSSPQWNLFPTITKILSEVSISDVKQNVEILNTGEEVILNSDMLMTKIELFDLDGTLLFAHAVPTNSFIIDKQELGSPLVILRVIYSDGKIETVKLNTKLILL